MLKDNKILLGKSEEKEIYLLPHQLNRHGLIAGASGTGKTITLKVIAESLSELGVPVFLADIKGDLSGMIKQGDISVIQERLDSMGITDFETKRYPVHFYDVYQEFGHPIRATIEGMGPLLISRILDLNEAQLGVLNIVFKVAKDMDLALFDLKDLQAMTSYVGEKSKDLTIKYGNVSKQSVGAILRQLLVLEQEGGELFFGQPSIDIEDWFYTIGNNGIMNILDCRKLVNSPSLYATFMLWLLTNLYERLPEVGDLDKPKMVFFFDEAHILFNNAPKNLMEKIIQTVKLIRSKGVGIFFCTQSPTDIPNEVLAQLSNRIQHSLRAYTPSEIKAVKLAANSFRANPNFDTAEVITNMKTGTALVSVLDEDGAPTIVEKTKILPPSSMMGQIDVSVQKEAIRNGSMYGKYEKSIDNISAYEEIDQIREKEAQLAEAEKLQKEQDKLNAIKQKEEAKAQAKKEKNQKTMLERISKKTVNQLENAASRQIVKTASSMLKNFLK
ncbi:MAG: DUF853 family protein [Erysipelotrichaceae bacterium]|nr:DUF853 family protein [Erysipelotrichaceae bacterium]